jgi:hypothetical protein
MKTELKIETPTHEVMLADIEKVRSISRIESETTQEWMHDFFGRVGTWLNANIDAECNVQNCWIMMHAAGLFK